MNFKVFMVFDSKAKAFITPFFLPTEGMAVRAFADCVNDPVHQFHKHPADYTLFRCGEWSSSLGTFSATALLESVVNGVQVLSKEPAPKGQLALVSEQDFEVANKEKAS